MVCLVDVDRVFAQNDAAVASAALLTLSVPLSVFLCRVLWSMVYLDLGYQRCVFGVSCR